MDRVERGTPAWSKELPWCPQHGELWPQSTQHIGVNHSVECLGREREAIYSGIVRVLDLALGAGAAARHLYLVAPDGREKDVRAQLERPAFSRVRDMDIRWLPYSALRDNREAMARFGTGLAPLAAVSRLL